MVVVTRAVDARPHGQPADVDRELFALFQAWLRYRVRFRSGSMPRQDRLRELLRARSALMESAWDSFVVSSFIMPVAFNAMQTAVSVQGTQSMQPCKLGAAHCAAPCAAPTVEGAQVMNENESPLLNKTREMNHWTNDTGPLSADDFEESNKKHEMNGFLYCNTPGLVAPFGRKCAAAAPLSFLVVLCTVLEPVTTRGMCGLSH